MLIHLARTASAEDRAWLDALLRRPRREKTQADAERVLEAMHRNGSIGHALDVADRLAHRGTRRFERDLAFIDENEGKGVLRQVANYVTTRPL
jgi:geranylgeranyl diphosphate synthase type II